MRLLAETGDFNAPRRRRLRLRPRRHARHHPLGGQAHAQRHRVLRRRPRRLRPRQRRRHRGRLPERLDVPRLRRPDVPVRLRRLGHRPRRLPVVPAGLVPARRADAQRGQVHGRRRAGVPPEGAPRAGRDRDQHAADQRHLPGRAARRRGRRDRGAGGDLVPVRGDDLRRLHGRLRGLRRHAGDDVGADHQGRDADDRGHDRRRRGAGQVQLQPVRSCSTRAADATTPTATRSSARAPT